MGLQAGLNTNHNKCPRSKKGSTEQRGLSKAGEHKSSLARVTKWSQRSLEVYMRG